MHLAPADDAMEREEAAVAMPRPYPDDAPSIVVITGIQAAGKSTVANLLARRFARGVHVEADVLHRMIVSGNVAVEEPGEPRGAAAAQLRLRLHQACLLGRSFVGAGFTVVLDEIVIGERWAQLQDELRGVPFSLVVLAPQAEVAIVRDAERAKRTRGADWAHYLDHALRATMADKGLWIDTSAQTPQETVEAILQRLGLPAGRDGRRAAR